jgi:hypothetical protein
MPEELFLYGVYSIHVRALALQGARWDAEYEIRHLHRPVQHWQPVGGDAGLADAATAIDLAHRRAVADIEAGAGVPKPATSP